MRKSIYLGLIISIFPSLCLAGNPRITKLMREKQAKMEQLEKCMGSSKGLKIAGISTLGLTAVGVAGNIAEAKVIQDYNDRIESTDKNIEKTKIEIQEKRDALDAKEEAEAKRIAAEEQAKKEGRILRNVAMQDIARINNGGYNGDKAVSHGYMPERLPDGLRSQFANAMVNFISRCRSLIGQYGIKEVSLSPSVQENWRQYLGSSPLAEDVILDDLNEHIIAECKITECNLETHTVAYDSYGISCMPKPGVNGGVTTTQPTQPTQPTVTTTATSEQTTATQTTATQTTKINIAEKCTEEFAGVSEAYRIYNGAEFCAPFDWDSKEIVSAKCNELGMSLCELPPAVPCPDNDTACKESSISYWVCSTNCSVIPKEYTDRPDWLRIL